MAAAKKSSKKRPALKTNRTVGKVKLRLDEKEKWRGEINGCDVAFWVLNENEFWCWSGITPVEWGACLGGVHFDSIQDAVRDAKDRCVAPAADQQKPKAPHEPQETEPPQPSDELMGEIMAHASSGSMPEHLAHLAAMLGVGTLPIPEKTTKKKKASKKKKRSSKKD